MRLTALQDGDSPIQVQKPPVNLAELLANLVAEALKLFIQRGEPFGDQLDIGPQALGNYLEMSASLRGAGLDIVPEFLLQPIKASVEGVGSHNRYSPRLVCLCQGYRM